MLTILLNSISIHVLLLMSGDFLLNSSCILNLLGMKSAKFTFLFKDIIGFSFLLLEDFQKESGEFRNCTKI